MSLYELEIGWAETANDRRYLHWELLACDEVLGVFPTDRDDSLAVLFVGERSVYDCWVGSIVPAAVAPRG